jgi:hypothetical protein
MTTQMEHEMMEEARSSTKMLGGCELFILAVSIFAALYFGFGAVYRWGYATGYADNVPTRQSCMEWIVRYSK